MVDTKVSVIAWCKYIFNVLLKGELSRRKG